MNLLYACNVVPYPSFSGNRKRHLDEIVALTEEFKVYLVIISDETIGDEAYGFLSSLCVRILLIKPNSRFIRLKQVWSIHSKWTLSSRVDTEAIVKLRKIILSIQPAVAIANYYDVLSILLNADVDIKKLVFIPHDIPDEIYSNASKVTNNLFLKLYYKIELFKHERDERLFNHKLFNIVVFTERDKYYFVRRYLDANVFVSPIGINSLNFKAEQTTFVRDKSVFLIVGSGRHPVGEKEVWNFISKIALLLTRDITIRIVGPNWRLGHYKFGRLKVEFVGYVPNLRAEYDGAVAFIVPLFNPTGMNVKIVEALVNGIPLLSTIEALDRLPASHSISAIRCRSCKDFAEAINNSFDQGFHVDHSKNLEYVQNNLSNTRIMKNYVSLIRAISFDPST